MLALACLQLTQHDIDELREDEREWSKPLPELDGSHLNLEAFAFSDAQLPGDVVRDLSQVLIIYSLSSM